MTNKDLNKALIKLIDSEK